MAAGEAVGCEIGARFACARSLVGASGNRLLGGSEAEDEGVGCGFDGCVFDGIALAGHVFENVAAGTGELIGAKLAGVGSAAGFTGAKFAAGAKLVGGAVNWFGVYLVSG